MREGPLAKFFSQRTNFVYNPSNSSTTEFYRLCDSNGWKRDDDEKEEAKMGFQDALTMQFNEYFGTDVNDLTKWQALCALLRMNPVPKSVYECREAVRSKHINLVDLVDNFRTQRKKYFPKHNANAGNLLKFLLRQILHPELSQNDERAHGQGNSREGGRRHAHRQANGRGGGLGRGNTPRGRAHGRGRRGFGRGRT